MSSSGSSSLRTMLLNPTLFDQGQERGNELLQTVGIAGQVGILLHLIVQAESNKKKLSMLCKTGTSSLSTILLFLLLLE